MTHIYTYAADGNKTIGVVSNDTGKWRFERWGYGEEPFIQRGTGFVSADAALAGLYQCTMTK